MQPIVRLVSPEARLVFAALVLSTLSACGPGSAPSLDGVSIRLSADDAGAEACRVERIARVDQDVTPLYLMRGEAVYAADGFAERRIPVQVRFLTVEGPAEDRAVTLTDLPVPCAEVSIDLVIDECVSVERTPTACPTVTLDGQDAFATVRFALAD